MGQFLLLVVVALTVGAVVFGVTVLLTGGDGGLSPAEPDGRAVPLPGTRPLTESDIARVRFDVTSRGYRMAQVDQAMRRAAYDIGYKDELINVLEAEVDALRSGRFSDAEVLRRAREAAQAAAPQGTVPEGTAAEGAAGPVPAEGTQEGNTSRLGEVPQESGAGPGPVLAGPVVAGPEPAGSQAPDLAGPEPAGSEPPDLAGHDQPAGEAGPSGPGERPPEAQEWAADGTAEAAGQRAAADRDGDGSDESEPDSMMQSRR